MSRAVIALGSNLGDRFGYLQKAVDAFSCLDNTDVLKVSSVFSTPPMHYEEQPTFLNAVMEISTNLSPNALLGVCLGIEAANGRIRRFKNGPRELDLDVLIYENVTMETDELWLPHPRMMERPFVLVPLFDIYPDFRALNVNFKSQYDELSMENVHKFKYEIKA